MKVLFLAKKGDDASSSALSYLHDKGFDVEHHFGEWGDKLPHSAAQWRGDIIISYLSRWIVPQALLDRANIAAINFHPAPPEYPGIGCNNFALYNNEKTFGVTCHHMKAAVDTGEIIATKEFDLDASDNVESILKRAYDAQLALFQEVIDTFVKDGKFAVANKQWARKPYTRKEFEELFIITPQMDADEVQRRVRAVSFRQYQPYIKLHGHTFKLVPNEAQ
ncbi:Bifunctional polymyxin resistance protein ArnA [Pseudoalteromonas sp. THAF3]|uniref:formyltransferase family protein n=1 Tax=Pseudoalteromonas TaxID=53246 RepID=UPI00124912E9|nr:MULTISPECIES: formyltransferase family protein [Pseudoalteromonas]QFU03795.1 Bifunctional polymyxin resistance protein ArnA [Pseudoalteromonas sp. THAF3]|tara:strand:- start:18504 stop:19166 length:663 start_codon:yes stop_codon:yes gene_type:complete